MRETMGTHARSRILEHYCWDIIAQEWITFFDATRPTLSLCMIVKNEEATIERCLASVAPIADELVVVDTGSRDRTKEKALACGATVYDFAWCDDFAAARNFALDKARSDWILVLDADEVLGTRDHAKVRQLLNVRDSFAYRLFQRSYLANPTVMGWKPNTFDDPEGKGYGGFFDSPLIRLFRNHCGFQFEGRVHEVLEPSILRTGKRPITTDIPIHHYGKVCSEKTLKEKGELYLAIGKTRAAEQATDPRALYDLAAQYFELSQLAEAKQYYLKVLELDGAHYRALCDLGCIYAREGNFTEACASLERALTLNANYLSIYVNLCIVYRALGRIDDAVALCQRGLALDPRNSILYMNLGFLYYSRDDYDQAIVQFRKARECNPNLPPETEHAMASYRKGLVHFEKHEYQAARTFFEEVITLAPAFPSVYINLGIICLTEGQNARAEEYFKHVIALTEMNAQAQGECVKAYVNLGYLYNNNGAYLTAMEYLEKGLELQPTNPEIYNHLGIAKCGLGHLQDGIKFFEMTLQVDPEHHAARTNLKRVKELLVQERNYKSSTT